RTIVLVCFFVFQAEDGIRDRNVTGVQTCALPIWFCTHVHSKKAKLSHIWDFACSQNGNSHFKGVTNGYALWSLSPNGSVQTLYRSEERRVGTDGWTSEVAMSSNKTLRRVTAAKAV